MDSIGGIYESPSSLRAYTQCWGKHEALFLGGGMGTWPLKRKTNPAGFYAIVGEAVHRTAEAYVNEEIGLDRGAFLARYKDEWDAMTGGADSRDAVSRGAELLGNLIRFFRGEHHELRAGAIEDRAVSFLAEHAIELKLDTKRDGKVRVRGFADLVYLEDDGDFVIVDYKTGAAPWNYNFQRSFDCKQLRIYAAGAWKKNIKYPIRIEAWYLKKGLVFTERISESTVSRTKTWCRKTIREIHGEEHGYVTPGRHCDYCPLSRGECEPGARSVRNGHVVWRA